MKAYKITNNGKCKNQDYEVGQTYKIKGDLIMCKNGFHFCKNPNDLFEYYSYIKNITKIFEIEILGECIDEGTKSVTDKLKVVREIPLNEYNILFNNHKFDNCGNLNYHKRLDGFEYWNEYDNNNKLVHFKDSTGHEFWSEYDECGNIIHYKDSNGFEKRYVYDDNGKFVHYKESTGYEEWYCNKFKYKLNLILNKISNYFKFKKLL